MESKKSKYISKIAVSTDDDRIISHIKKYKIDYIIKRKKIFLLTLRKVLM